MSVSQPGAICLIANLFDGGALWPLGSGIKVCRQVHGLPRLDRELRRICLFDDTHELLRVLERHPLEHAVHANLKTWIGLSNFFKHSACDGRSRS